MAKKVKGSNFKNMLDLEARKRLRFSPEIFKRIAEDLTSGRIPLPRQTITDPLTTGLRAIIRDTGLVSFHAHLDVAGERPMLDLGEFPREITIEEARELTRTIRGLAGMGIDVRDGLHKRLLRELQEKKLKWRP